MKKENCPLCGDNDTTLFHDSVWNAAERRVMNCNGCESYFLSPRLNEMEQREFDKNYNAYINERAILVSKHSEEEFDDLVDESVETRYVDLMKWFEPKLSVLEVGAEKGGFLDRIAPIVGEITSVDTCPEYVEILEAKGYSAYSEIWDVPQKKKFDRICMFSLLEHILDPQPFLARLYESLKPSGLMIIEIPSAKEPLISLYNIPDFKSFYFQAMHPYVYSVKAVRRVLEETGLKISEVKYKQRYGLANHLNWLRNGTPGGNEKLAAILSGAADQEYCHALELIGHTDSVYIIATRPQ